MGSKRKAKRETQNSFADKRWHLQPSFFGYVLGDMWGASTRTQARLTKNWRVEVITPRILYLFMKRIYSTTFIKTSLLQQLHLLRTLPDPGNQQNLAQSFREF